MAEPTNPEDSTPDRSFAAVSAGLDMALQEAMLTQRAVRRVLPDPVDDEIVLRCIELALKTPTGSNGQNWEFVVVKKPEVKRALAARAMGLGASLITLPLWSTTAARRALGLPVSVLPACVVPLGWPRGRLRPTTRRPVGDVVHLDRYGNRAFRTGA